MGKTSKRRLRKIAQRYADLLAAGKVDVFRCAWEKHKQEWLNEIQRRMALHRRVEESVSSNMAQQVNGHDVKAEIFGVLDAANRLLRACGAAVEEAVGMETRVLLTNECAKAVAAIYDRRLYQPVKRGLYGRDR